MLLPQLLPLLQRLRPPLPPSRAARELARWSRLRGFPAAAARGMLAGGGGGAIAFGLSTRWPRFLFRAAPAAAAAAAAPLSTAVSAAATAGTGMPLPSLPPLD